MCHVIMTLASWSIKLLLEKMAAESGRKFLIWSLDKRMRSIGSSFTKRKTKSPTTKLKSFLFLLTNVFTHICQAWNIKCHALERRVKCRQRMDCCRDCKVLVSNSSPYNKEELRYFFMDYDFDSGNGVLWKSCSMKKGRVATWWLMCDMWPFATPLVAWLCCLEVNEFKRTGLQSFLHRR